MRRLGEIPERAQKYTRRPGAYAVILRGNDALITMSDELTPELQLPGGGIDPGESPIHALHREVMEETGWRIQIEHRLGCYRRFCYMPEYDRWAEKICAIYLCSPVRQISEPTEAHHSIIWTKLHLLPALLDDPTQGEFVASIL